MIEYPPLLPPEVKLKVVRESGNAKTVTLGIAGTRPTCLTVTKGV
jgi:hypothetical protein